MSDSIDRRFCGSVLLWDAPFPRHRLENVFHSNVKSRRRTVGCYPPHPHKVTSIPWTPSTLPVKVIRRSGHHVNPNAGFISIWSRICYRRKRYTDAQTTDGSSPIIDSLHGSGYLQNLTQGICKRNAEELFEKNFGHSHKNKQT